MLQKTLSEYLVKHTLIGIKGGLEREKFTEIWMVEVNGRFFSRSWSKSERSWFTEFLKTGVGQIKAGETTLNVQGLKVDKNDLINQEIDKAYLEKYHQPGNVKYAIGISQPEYADYTMEFRIIETKI